MDLLSLQPSCIPKKVAFAVGRCKAPCSLVIIPESRDNAFELVSVNWGPLSVDGA
jgi:hypothetical protein